MHTYRITLNGKVSTVRATFPAVAVKRVMDGGKRVRLRRGETVTVAIERIE
jgi:hypothetical protein